MNNIELFKLGSAGDLLGYEGFALWRVPSLLGRTDLTDDISPPIRTSNNPRCVAVHLGAVWKAPKVTGKVSPLNDFPGMNLMYPVFSRRACECLSEFLAPSGELLPLDTSVGEYFFFHITKMIDAIDHGKSVCTYSKSDPLRVGGIKEYAFREELLDGADIFRTWDVSIEAIVSGRFVEKVISSGLRGFCFKKMWPHPPGTNWRLTKYILPETSLKNGPAS